MDAFWKTALSIAGIGAVVSFVIWSLYRQWLKLPIFQQLTKEQQFKLFRLFLIFTFLLALTGLVAYVYIKSNSASISSGDIPANVPLPVPTFTQRVETFNFSLGERGISVGYKVSALENKAVEPYNFRGFKPVKLYLENGTLFADVSI